MPLTRLKSPEAAARWLSSWVRGTLRTDSRQVQPGDAFIAWPGYANDGRQFVRQALVAGATTCLVEDEGVAAFSFDDARVATLPALKAATGAIAHAYFGQPSCRSWPAPAPTARPAPRGGRRRHSRGWVGAAASSARWVSANPMPSNTPA
jgi:hypothetical protein